LVENSKETQENLEISFVAYGKTFTLELKPNPLFSQDAANIWTTGWTEQTEAPTIALYKGVVRGEPESWVRVSLREDVIEGMIWTQGEIYFLEPGTRFVTGANTTPPATIMYRMSDTTSTWDLGSCALERSSAEFDLESHVSQRQPLSDYATLSSHLQEAAAAGQLKKLDIALIADYEYYQEHGANSAADMQNIINQIDGIYQAELGLTLYVATTVVYTTPADPFSSTIDPVTLLQEFSSYKSQAASAIRGADLAHLFTNRDLQGSVIGVAWLGTLCNTTYGTGLSQDFINENKSLVLLTAHEIGHNLAAPHDNQSGSACASTPFGYIMNPWVSTSLQLQFSTCSKQQMAQEIAEASCLETVDGGGPVSPTCTSSISPGSRTHSATATIGTVNVSTENSCTWKAKSNVNWITITSGGAGTGSGNISYKLKVNSGSNLRKGTLTIAGKTFTISQSGLCSYALSLYGRKHGARAGTGSFSINTSGQCSWNATSNANWIKITSTISGTGRTAIRYSVAPNTTKKERTGTITIADKIFTITQSR
ncbi:MAG: M12 family metallo-peptidase, partial [Candidatus Binatia bacterium]